MAGSSERLLALPSIDEDGDQANDAARTNERTGNLRTMQGGIGTGNDSEYTDKEGHKLPDPCLDNLATQLLSFHRSAMFGFLFN